MKASVCHEECHTLSFHFTAPAETNSILILTLQPPTCTEIKLHKFASYSSCFTLPHDNIVSVCFSEAERFSRVADNSHDVQTAVGYLQNKAEVYGT
ncbi:UNVERIFIED_CONTAM: hypothetical protein K2H54_007343 [Gekko kuhli]